MRRSTFFGLVALAGAAAGITVGVLAGTTGVFDASKPGPFDWFVPGPPPTGWKHVALPAGSATMFYPARFERTAGDPGTVTAQIQNAAGLTIGYLNATPRQGNETLDNWADFRLDHQHDEETHIRSEARVSRLAFRGGTGSCVIDNYLTPQGSHPYREIACYVVGGRGASVIVASAPPALWSTVGPELEQAVSAYDVT
jgi:hypothetical protein